MKLLSAGDKLKEELEILLTLPLSEDVKQVFKSWINEHEKYRDKEAYQIKFPVMLRKMWSGEEVQRWLDDLPALYDDE